MSHKFVERVIHNFRWLILCGLALSLGSLNLGGFGLLTGWAAMSLGACGGTFHRWREEPGLWMLSGLFFPVFSIGLAFFAYASFLGHSRGGAPGPSDCDDWGATLLYAALVYFLVSVTWTNWPLKKQTAIPG